MYNLEKVLGNVQQLKEMNLNINNNIKLNNYVNTNNTNLKVNINKSVDQMIKEK